METRYADFHIHIGRSGGRPVKMAAAPSLTLASLLHHARCEKGLDIVTVIDGVCPPVLSEVETLLEQGSLMALDAGGFLHENGLTVLLGAEVETGGPHGGAAHFGCWFGSVAATRDFATWLATVQTNVTLSSQRARVTALQLQGEVQSRGGLFIVHHAFTPHKGLIGNCVDRISDMLDPHHIDAIELGLSADSDMADCISELSPYTFITNSDAHSLPKIAREYNAITCDALNFQTVAQVLRRTSAARVIANYGLHPALGKYHRSSCMACGQLKTSDASVCACGSERFSMGVYDRLCVVRDREQPVHPDHRPPYVHQVPLEFVPGLGPKLRQRLLQALGTEMQILHRATVQELADVVGDTLADRIDAARRGISDIAAGGGGTYGKIMIGP